MTKDLRIPVINWTTITRSDGVKIIVPTEWAEIVKYLERINLNA